MCLSKGLFYLQNPEHLDWIDVVGKGVTINPSFEKVYSSLSYISFNYRTQTFILTLSPVRLYNIPSSPILSIYPLISSKFGDIS